MPAPDSPFFVAGGTLPRDAPSYITRAADQELYDALHRGEFCYVLTARQTGKSSLMIRTAARLRAEGATVASLDLTAVGQNISPEQWYRGLLGRLGRQLDIESELKDAWSKGEGLSPLQRWVDTISTVLLTRFSGPIVLFVDEIDAVRSLPFSADEFFAAIRECYNRRAADAAFRRLTFCFLGVASPADLIKDVRISPFNIGRRIELTDFTPQEAAPLARGLSGSNAVLDRILYWTGGHPYLTQRLCQEMEVVGGRWSVLGVGEIGADTGVCPYREGVEASVRVDGRNEKTTESRTHPLYGQTPVSAPISPTRNHLYGQAPPAAGTPSAPTPNTQHPTPKQVDHQCATLFLGSGTRDMDDNLLFVQDRLLRGDADTAALLDLYAKILDGRAVRDGESGLLEEALRLSGIVRLDGRGYWRPRNRIYETVFSRRWVRENLPDAERRRQRDAYRRGLFRAALIATTLVASFGALAFVAFRYAYQAGENERVAKARATELKAAVESRDKALTDLKKSLKAEESQRHRADREAEKAHNREKQANRDRAEATRHKTIAVARTRESRERQKRLLIAYGSRLQEEGDLYGSLLWYVQAARLESSDPARRRIHQIRIGTLLKQLPRLEQMWSGVRTAGFSSDGRTILAANRDGTARVYDAASGAAVSPILGDGNLPDARVVQIPAQFTPEGHRVATFRGGMVRIWDTRTGKPISPPLTHSYRVESAAIRADGRRVVTSGDGCVRLWDADTGRMLNELKEGDAIHTVNQPSFAPDGRHIYVVTHGNQSLLWDSSAKRVFRTMPWANCSIVFAKDGIRVATGAPYPHARVWNTETDAPITPTLPHNKEVTSVCFSPEGSRIATTSFDFTAQIWDATTGARIGTPLQHSNEVYKVCFSPDGRRVATASADTTVRIWDAATGAPLLPPLKHLGSALSVSFDAEGHRLLSVDQAGFARLWNVAGAELPDQFLGEYSNVGEAAFSPDGRLIATTDFDFGARLWDTATGKPVGPLLTHLLRILAIAFSPDGTRLATAGRDGLARIWDVASGKMLRQISVPDQIQAVAFSPDGKRLVTGCMGQANIWEIASGKKSATLREPRAHFRRISFNRYGSRIVTKMDVESTIPGRSECGILWDARSGKSLFHLPVDGLGIPRFSPDGRRLMVVADNRVRLWDITGSEPVLLWSRKEFKLYDAVFRPDGRRIVTACGSGESRVLDTETGQPTSPPLLHPGPALGVAFSHDGRLIATFSQDNTARVWDSETGDPVTPPLMHGLRVRSLSFSPDDHRLLTVCDDGVGRIWELASDSRSPDDLSSLAELLTSHRISPEGDLTGIEVNALQTAWNHFPAAQRSAYGSSSRQMRSWHEEQAVNALDQRQWERSLPHLDRLIAEEPSPLLFHGLCAYACAMLGRWDRVMADNARIGPSSARLILLAGQLATHRRVPLDGKPPLQIGAVRYQDGLYGSNSPSKILVLLPSPGARFTAVAGVTMESLSATDAASYSVIVQSREVFHAAGLRKGQQGVPVSVDLNGATGFLLDIRNHGPDARYAWADARVILKNGRAVRLADCVETETVLPIGGL